MPTVLWDGPYAFVFFSSDRDEPPHIHVKRDRQIAKYWLKPVSLETAHSFSPHELRHIERLVVKHRIVLLEAWHEYFDIGE